MNPIWRAYFSEGVETNHQLVKPLGITYLVGKIKFKLLFHGPHGPLAE